MNKNVKINTEVLTRRKQDLQRLMNIINTMILLDDPKMAGLDKINEDWFMHFLLQENFIISEDEEWRDDELLQMRKECFIHNLLGEGYEPLSDFDKTFDYLVSQLDSDRERYIIRKRIYSGESHNEIGYTLKLSGARIGQIEKSIMKKFKDSSMSKYFIHGLEGAKEINKALLQEKMISQRIDNTYHQAKNLNNRFVEIDEKIRLEFISNLEQFSKRTEMYSKWCNNIINEINADCPNCDSLLSRAYETISNPNSIMYDDMLGTRIKDLKLSNRSYRWLKRAHIETISDLLSLSIDDLYRIKYLQENGRIEIVRKIESLGINNWITEEELITYKDKYSCIYE